MAEFQEVMRQINRICSHYQNCCEDSDCLLCGVCGSLGYYSSNAKQAMQIEERVMKWAAEHPEPVYPTWWEYINNDYINSILLETNKAYNTIIGFMKHTPIPADIAEKLGIEPKKVTKDG